VLFLEDHEFFFRSKQILLKIKFLGPGEICSEQKKAEFPKTEQNKAEKQIGAE
jgi:hypothetical protein